LNSSKIISIQEELTFGTNKISINVDSEVIEEFIAKTEDFLKYMMETSF
jgi:hypothetical protein